MTGATTERRWVEHHMTTAITVAGDDLTDQAVAEFFDRIRELEDVLSRFRPHSPMSRLARGEVGIDDVDPAIRDVIARCEALRALTAGEFDHEPRRRSGDRADPVLDADAVAKGWIVDDAAMALRATGSDFFVNAGGDVLVRRRERSAPAWRVGIQHPGRHDAIVGVMELQDGAVATSGSYERGQHIRSHDDGSDPLVSVTVAGPDLGEADGLSTAVFACGDSPPRWWRDVDPAYGLLTMSSSGRLRWFPPAATASGVRWTPAPSGARRSRSADRG